MVYMTYRSADGPRAKHNNLSTYQTGFLIVPQVHQSDRFDIYRSAKVRNWAPLDSIVPGFWPWWRVLSVPVEEDIDSWRRFWRVPLKLIDKWTPRFALLKDDDFLPTIYHRKWRRQVTNGNGVLLSLRRTRKSDMIWNWHPAQSIQ